MPPIWPKLTLTFKSKEEGKDQLPRLTLDTIWDSGTNTWKHHIQESQDKAARNRQESIHATDKHETQITKRIHKRSTALEQ